MMNRYEAALTQQGLTILAAHLDGDYAGRDALVEEFMRTYEFQRLADAFTYTAIVAIELAATAQRMQFDMAVRNVNPDPEAILLPGLPSPWQEAVWLAEHVKHGGPDINLSASAMDVPGAVNGSFQLAASALRALEAVPPLEGKTAGEWTALLLASLAAGEGVDD
jgi:hypothetical protein